METLSKPLIIPTNNIESFIQFSARIKVRSIIFPWKSLHSSSSSRNSEIMRGSFETLARSLKTYSTCFERTASFRCNILRLVISFSSRLLCIHFAIMHISTYVTHSAYFVCVFGYFQCLLRLRKLHIRWYLNIHSTLVLKFVCWFRDSRGFLIWIAPGYV